MGDILMVGLTVVLFAVAFAFVQACTKLK